MRVPLFFLPFLMAGLLALSACSSREYLNETASSSDYWLSQGVVYDDATSEKLDVYTPRNLDKAPVVVFFYGGRWSGGRKEDYKFVGQALAAKGFVAVIPDVRPYPQVRFPEFLNDAAKAVVWVHGHIASYRGSPNRIVVMGHSSGAYDAAMLALNPELLLRAGGNRTWLRGMIGLAGPYDFLPITDPDLRDLFGPPENFERTQPVFYVDGTNPPLLLMHGAKDETVSIRNTIELFDRVKRANGTADKVIFDNLDQSRILDVVASGWQDKATVMQNIADFVNKVTTGLPPSALQPSSIQTYVPPK